MVKRIRIILIILCIVAAAAIVFEATRPYRPENPIDNFVDELIDREFAPTDEDYDETEFPIYIEFPADAVLDELFVVSPGRQEYKDGDMVLSVPALNIIHEVKNGTSQVNLLKNPALFAASGLPGEPGANVSIAGHRTHDMFYYLDRIGAGDRIYVFYDSKIYTYVFHDRDEVLPTDWSVISEQGYDCVTLITCTPIRVADKRMVVRFILESVVLDDINLHNSD